VLGEIAFKAEVEEITVIGSLIAYLVSELFSSFFRRFGEQKRGTKGVNFASQNTFSLFDLYNKIRFGLENAGFAAE